MVARLSLSNEELSIHLWLLIASSTRIIPLSASSLQTKGIFNWEVNIRNFHFSKILASGSSITFLMPCNISFPANLETKTCHRLQVSDNLHPTGAFDESRFNKNSHPNFDRMEPVIFEG